MINFEVVSRTQVCAQRSLNAFNETGARTGWCGLVHHVGSAHAILLAASFHGFPILVFADAAHVGSRTLGLQHPLSYADGVLGCTSSNILHTGTSGHLCEQWLVF